MKEAPVEGISWASAYHAPVLAAEVLALLGGARRVLDGTLGGGGHAQALLEGGADVTAFDRDPHAIAAARERLAAHEARGAFRAIAANFTDPAALEAVRGGGFDAILLDLGVSSHQLDDAARGFSFREGAPLDMRMGADTSETAAQWLDRADEQELAYAFKEYADEPRAGRLAREIIRRRATRPYAVSDDLVGAIRGAFGPRTGPGDFARLFQAVRIAVNDELTGLADALPRLRDALVQGGVLAVISYHSGEDRLVKHAFREWSAECICPPKQPMCTCRGRALGTTLTRKAVSAAEVEIASNPRARSAHLRAWRRAG
jgi:16S rRNA (cytosine1402-N4)-methyltransferase